jgi:signal transduction histidine kinase
MCGGLLGDTVRAVRRLENLLTRARGIDPRAVDAVVAVALVAGAVAVAAAGRHHGPLTLLAAVATCATVAWRRRAPAAMTTVLVVSIAVFGVSSRGVHTTIQPIGVVLEIAAVLDYYMLGRLSVQRGRPEVNAVLLVAAVAAIVTIPAGSVERVATNWTLFVGVPFAAGRAVGSRVALTRELRANAQRLEREQQERARHAAAEERNRIARELHDVVAHGVSVMVIQTQAARRVAAGDREAARDALSSVQSCGRDALMEMRRMIGVLRHGDEQLAGATAPALSQLGGLVARARAAGLPVELRIDGEARALSPGLDLVAFRVVQEALTNAIKHAGAARALVRVTFTAGALELEISDTGRGPALADGDTDAAGQGLVGMRERLVLYGGELETGRAGGGGFKVRARIPLTETVTT